jgi:hypothetical protein
MAITHITGPIRTMAITDRTLTMATIPGLHSIGTADIGITATTVIIGTITGTNQGDLGLKKSIELAREQFRASFFAMRITKLRTPPVVAVEQFICFSATLLP